MLQYPFGSGRTWQDLERMRRELNRQFESTSVATYPSVNVWTNEDGAVVTAELPGIDPEALDISVRENTLTINGSRERGDVPEEAAFHRRERGFGSFRRALQLPFAVEAGEVEATYEKGVLTILLPRAEADKPRKIQVKQG